MTDDALIDPRKLQTDRPITIPYKTEYQVSIILLKKPKAFSNLSNFVCKWVLASIQAEAEIFSPKFSNNNPGVYSKMLGDTVFTQEQVAAHHSTKSIWVSVKGKVYDITHFLGDHPGGSEILLQYGGKDVTEVMKGDEHMHSESAYEMLESYYVGDVKAAKDKAPVKSKVSFIDPTKPMLSQVFYGNFSKKFYMEQIHIARHVPYSAPIFGHPMLEVFTKTVWWAIPLFWAPFISYTTYQATLTLSESTVVLCFAGGLFLWTFIEYALHRFLFHMDDLMPDHTAALTLHLYSQLTPASYMECTTFFQWTGCD
jgi:cytochrome b involved in lipid metabolism